MPTSQHSCPIWLYVCEMCVRLYVSMKVVMYHCVGMEKHECGGWRTTSGTVLASYLEIGSLRCSLLLLQVSRLSPTCSHFTMKALEL